MDIRFAIWSIRSLYRSGSITTVIRELMRYKIDLFGTQEGRWDKGGTVRPVDYVFSMEKGLKSWNLSRMFVHHRLVSTVKRVEIVSDRMLYIVLRGRWCNNIVMNVPAPSEEKNDYSKDSSYEEVSIIFLSTIRICCINVLNDWCNGIFWYLFGKHL